MATLDPAPENSPEVPVYKLVIRSSTGWSKRDLERVSRLAGALRHPPAEVTSRGLELQLSARNREAARAKLEMAVQGIHSHSGVYLDEEIRL
jgi:hypothetical protein